MSNDRESVKVAYRRVILHKAVELSKRHGGLRRIPSNVLVENGIGIVTKGGTSSVSVTLPSEDVMKKRIAEAEPIAKPTTAREVEKFKLSPEPTPREISGKTTMEDFWIEEGWYKVDRNGWRLTPGKWKDDEETRIRAIKFLVEVVLRKDPRDVTSEDLNSNKLRGLLPYYSDSPYKVVSEAFPELNIKPWEMSTTPRDFYEEKENRVKAVKWLVKKLGKDPRDITQEDFESNRLRGLLPYYSGSPHKAVSEAFPEFDIKPWEMIVTPRGFYEEKENRVAAVKWLVKKLDKDLRNVTQEDFHSNRLGGLLNAHYSDSPYEAVSKAFPKLKIKPWEMKETPNRFYKKKENRVKAVKWLVENLDKDPRDITVEDFYFNRLGGLLSHQYSNSPYKALLEAGLVTQKDEEHMRSYYRKS